MKEENQMVRKGAVEAIEDLTMILLYLTKFTEKDGGFEMKNMSWNGYPFSILNKFADEGLIEQGKHPSRSKRVWIRPEGIEYAQKLLEKYEIKDRKEE